MEVQPSVYLPPGGMDAGAPDCVVFKALPNGTPQSLSGNTLEVVEGPIKAHQVSGLLYISNLLWLI